MNDRGSIFIKEDYVFNKQECARLAREHLYKIIHFLIASKNALPQDAQDAAQEAFCDFIKYTNHAKITSYEHARNTVYKMAGQRLATIQKRTLLEQNTQTQLIESLKTDMPATTIIDNDVFAALCMLEPTEYKEVLVLKLIYGFDNADIAEIIHKSKKHVENTYSRAKKKLKDLLEKE